MNTIIKDWHFFSIAKYPNNKICVYYCVQLYNDNMWSIGTSTSNPISAKGYANKNHDCCPQINITNIKYAIDADIRLGILQPDNIPGDLYSKVFGDSNQQEQPIAHWVKCDCGAEKCGTTHATWCSTQNR